jgi:hypothetical protein
MSTVPCYESTGKPFARQLERERVAANMSALPITTERTVPVQAKLPMPAQFCEGRFPYIVNALYTEPDVVRRRRLFLKNCSLKRSVRFSPAHRSARAPGRRPVRARQRSRSASSHSASASSGSSADPPADPPSPTALCVWVLTS